MSFNINNKLIFINSIQLSLSLHKNLGSSDFNYLSQEFDNKVLGLVKKKRI